MRKVFLLLPVLLLLSACRMVALPGQEPFGEHTYADDQSQSVYEDVQEAMEPLTFEDWRGYSIELNDSDIYYSEEYQVAWHEGRGEDTLWYQGRLYRWDGETLAYRDMKWEELQTDAYAAAQWDFARSLLSGEAEELTYKHIPMSSVSPYLLTAQYPETEWEGILRRFPKLSFGMNGDKELNSFTLRWQESGESVGIRFYVYEGSTDLQAERKVWSFAHELGLIERGVPALSAQSDDREWSREMIASIDFDRILAQAEYREDLIFPQK